MAHMLHASSSECSVSALDLFYVPPTQTSVEKGTWINVHPIASVSLDQSNFSLKGSNKSFQTQLIRYCTSR